MQRRTNDPVDTKAVLIDAAMSLFSARGYDATSVQTIIDAVGVSKGAFYHYFCSKEDILDAVVERMTRLALDEITPLLEEKSLSAQDKLNRFLSASRRWRLAHLPLVKEAVRILLRDENIIIWHKMHRRSVKLVAPVLTDIIAQGVQEGVFDVAQPEETAELILHIGNLLGEKNARALFGLENHAAAPGDIEQRLQFAIEAIERLLGAPKGAIDRVDHAFIEEIMRVANTSE